VYPAYRYGLGGYRPPGAGGYSGIRAFWWFR
jgi:hypothetical protein